MATSEPIKTRNGFYSLKRLSDIFYDLTSKECTGIVFPVRIIEVFVIFYSVKSHDDVLLHVMSLGSIELSDWKYFE